MTDDYEELCARVRSQACTQPAKPIKRAAEVLKQPITQADIDRTLRELREKSETQR